MFREVEICLNQSDPIEYVKAEIKKNETLWSVNETAQAVCSPFIGFLRYFFNSLCLILLYV